MIKTVNLITNQENDLRDAGINYLPARGAQASDDYAEQLTYLLFLKMADERSNLPALLPVRDKTQTGGADKKPSSGNKKSIVPEKYNWPSLLKRNGDELFDHYRNTLRNLGKELKPEATIRKFRIVLQKEV